MFVGHGLLAFALVAALARAAGAGRGRALTLGGAAAAFATIPDVDILYAPLGLLGGVDGVFDAADAFWATGNVVHRSATHSVLVGGAAAVGLALWSGRYGGRPRGRAVAGTAGGLAVLLGVVATVAAVSGLLVGGIIAVYVAAGLVVATAAARRGVGPGGVFGVAAAGLLSHPFGDLFTGEPPALLYPLDATLLSDRVVLHPDPTLHLLGAFGLELATVWLAVAVYLSLRGERLRAQVSPRAALGVGYAGAAVALPAPTLDVSYHFVFGVLAVGLVGSASVRAGPDAVPPAPGRRALADAPARASVTGLTTVTLAALAYARTYAFV